MHTRVTAARRQGLSRDACHRTTAPQQQQQQPEPMHIAQTVATGRAPSVSRPIHRRRTSRAGPGTLSKSLSIIELSDERRQMLRMTRARRYCKRAFTPRRRRRRRQQAVNACADAVRVIFFRARAICDDDLMKYESKRSSLHVDAAADFFILRLLQPNTPTATALMNGCWTSSGKILGL